jgi:hypothetical protein
MIQAYHSNQIPLVPAASQAPREFALADLLRRVRRHD